MSNPGSLSTLICGLAIYKPLRKPTCLFTNSTTCHIATPGINLPSNPGKSFAVRCHVRCRISLIYALRSKVIMARAKGRIIVKARTRTRRKRSRIQSLQQNRLGEVRLLQAMSGSSTLPRLWGRVRGSKLNAEVSVGGAEFLNFRSGLE